MSAKKKPASARIKDLEATVAELRQELEATNKAALAQAEISEAAFGREQVLRTEFVKMTNVAQDLAEKFGKAEEKLAEAEERIAELEHEAQKNLRELDWWMADSDYYRGQLIEIAREREPVPEPAEITRARRELLGLPDDPEQEGESK